LYIIYSNYILQVIYYIINNRKYHIFVYLYIIAAMEKLLPPICIFNEIKIFVSPYLEFNSAYIKKTSIIL